MPTILESTGLKIHENITGVSVIRGLTDQCKKCKFIDGNYKKGTDMVDSCHMLTDGHIKYIWYNEVNIEHLSDLDNDQYEIYNLVYQKGYQNALMCFRERLISILEAEFYPDVCKGKLKSHPYPKLHLKVLQAMSLFYPRGIHF